MTGGCSFVDDGVAREERARGGERIDAAMQENIKEAVMEILRSSDEGEDRRMGRKR